jgi:DNA helicase-2/ATP-dependent DNA helicase PcrA
LRRPSGSWPEELDAVLGWYRPQLERLYDDAPMRAPDLEQLRRIAATYPSRERFLTELTLDPPAATSSEAAAPHLDEEYLTLSTIHSAKGQEWKSVQVLKCVDGCIPSDMSTGRAEDIEEERRILYVAMTRAKDHLALMLPQRFYTRQQSEAGDRHVYASRSRFLTNAVCRLLEHETWPIAPMASMQAPVSRGATVDLGARFRATWQRIAE